MDETPSTAEKGRQRIKPSQWALALVVTACFILLLFWTAGGLRWLLGWGYIALLLVGQTIMAFYLKRTNPELLRRRGEVGEGTKGWDRVVLGFFALTFLAVVVVAALDNGRFEWAPAPLWLWPVGAAMYVLGTVLVGWAMTVNTHFEKTVRIQHDRDHRVVEAGPYAYVRHPGYVGAAVAFPLATPLLLGSLWALIPALLCTVCLVIRTALEDRTLRAELAGYEEFTRRTRYRLVPGLW